MTNSQRAFELSNMQHFGYSIEESSAAYNAALTMAEWKDEQFAKEKEALIDKACEWLLANVSKHIHGPAYMFYKESMIEEFKQAMKGGIL